MILGNIAWWAAFFAVGIFMQRAMPGMDVLVAGLLVALQERKGWQIFWIALLLIILQEGMGTLEFGASLLRYPLVVCVFFIGRWLFETRNVLFVLLLSVCIGVVHLGVVLLISRLQYIAVDLPVLFDESVAQALLVSVVWKVVSLMRRSVVLHENSA